MAAIPARFPTQALDRVCAAAMCAGTWCPHMELEFDHRLDAERLRRAAHLLRDAEPVFGCRFVPRWPQPVWERINFTEGDNFVTLDNENAYRAHQRESLDIFQGPLVRVALWSKPSGQDRLIMTMTHAVTDAVDFYYTGVLLAEIYAALGKDPDYRPKPNLHGSRSYKQLLRHIPLKAHPRVLHNMGQQLREQKTAFPCHKLLFDAGGAHTETNYLIRTVPVERMMALMGYAKERGASMNDLMITTFLRGLAKAGNWDGQRAMTINYTIDLRRYLPDRRTSAICNLSCGQMLSLGRNLGDNFDATLASVNQIIRAQKENWIGLNAEVTTLPFTGLLPYRQIQRFIEKAMNTPPSSGWPADSISNIGFVPPSPLDFDGEPAAVLLLPQLLKPPRYQVISYIFKGEVFLVSGIYPSLEREQAVTRLFDAMLADLPA